MLHPSINQIMSSGEEVTLFGISIKAVTYSASVIPILLAVYCTKYIQKFCYKIIPETFKGLFTPPICIIIIIPLTLIVFGPIGSLSLIHI